MTIEYELFNGLVYDCPVLKTLFTINCIVTIYIYFHEYIHAYIHELIMILP